MAILATANTVSDFAGSVAMTDVTTTYARDTAINASEMQTYTAAEGISTFQFRFGEAADVWFHFRNYTQTMNSSAADGVWFEFVDANGVRQACVQALNGVYTPRVTASTGVISGSGMPVSSLTLQTFDFHLVFDGTNITLDCYLGGLLVDSATGVASGAYTQQVAGINFLHDDIWGSTGQRLYYSEFIVTSSESTLLLRSAGLTRASAGNYSEWTGDNTALDVRADGSALSALSSGLKQSWIANAFGTGTETIRAVAVNIVADTGAEATFSDVSPFVRLSSTDYTTTAVTVDGSLECAVFDVNPSNSSAWAVSDLAALELGLLSGS